MSVVSERRTVPLPVGRPLIPPVALLASGAMLCLAGFPAWSLAPIGMLLVWSLHEAECPWISRRLLGEATTLIALAFVLAVSMPVFLPPMVDQLAVVGLMGVALAAVLVSAPAARSVLRPRRPVPADWAWFVCACVVALVSAVGPLSTEEAAIWRQTAEVQTTSGELAAIAALVLLVPVLHEAVFRGLLAHVVGASASGLLLIALAQGLTAVPFFGWRGLAVGALLGAALGAVRWERDWQVCLFAHWGVALGFALPFVTAVGAGP